MNMKWWKQRATWAEESIGPDSLCGVLLIFEVRCPDPECELHRVHQSNAV